MSNNNSRSNPQEGMKLPDPQHNDVSSRPLPNPLPETTDSTSSFDRSALIIGIEKQREEYEHFQALFNAHQKRLRIIELIAAQKGSNTPPELLIEMQDISQKLEEVIGKAKAIHPDAEDKLVHKQVSSTASLSLMELNFQIECSFPPPQELIDATIRALAAILNISPADVKVLGARRGSLILLVELPTEAASNLRMMKLAEELFSIEETDLKEINLDTIEETDLKSWQNAILLNNLLEQQPKQSLP